MSSLRLIIHERLGYWVRHLKPRIVGWPIDWVETRSPADLEDALSGTACPIVVIDVADRPLPALEDLDRAILIAPNALALVLDPRAYPGVSSLARELGASHVLSGGVVPPAVCDLLVRWLRIAQTRNEADGWAIPIVSESDPWAGIGPLPTSTPDAARPPRP